MLTGEDIDRCLVEAHAADLENVDIETAKEWLAEATEEQDRVDCWVEALVAYIRLETKRSS